MATSRSSTKGRTFFIYDHTVLQKEEDDLKDAIIYFYPQSVDPNSQCALCGQLMGMVTFFANVLGSKPSLYRLVKEKYAVKHVGKYTLALAGDLSEPDPFLMTKLETLYSTFSFYQGSISLLEKHAEERELGSFTKAMAMVWNSYLPFIRCYDDDLPAAFKIIPSLKLPKNGASLFLRASHLLQAFKKKAGVLGGCLFFKNKVLCTQLSPELTAKLCLIKPIQAHFPCQAVKTDYDLPNRVRLIEVYLTKDEYEQQNGAYYETYSRESASENPDEEVENEICDVSFSVNADVEHINNQTRPRVVRRKLSPKSSSTSTCTSSDTGESSGPTFNQLAVIKESEKLEERLPSLDLFSQRSCLSDSGVASLADSSPELQKNQDRFHSDIKKGEYTEPEVILTVDVSAKSGIISQQNLDSELKQIPLCDTDHGKDGQNVVSPSAVDSQIVIASNGFNSQSVVVPTEVDEQSVIEDSRNKSDCSGCSDSQICDSSRETSHFDSDNPVADFQSDEGPTSSDLRWRDGGVVNEKELEVESSRDLVSDTHCSGDNEGHIDESATDSIASTSMDTKVKSKSFSENLKSMFGDILPVRSRSQTEDMTQVSSKSDFLFNKLRTDSDTKSLPEMLADRMFNIGQPRPVSAPNLVINEPEHIITRRGQRDESSRKRSSTLYYDAFGSKDFTKPANVEYGVQTKGTSLDHTVEEDDKLCGKDVDEELCQQKNGDPLDETNSDNEIILKDSETGVKLKKSPLIESFFKVMATSRGEGSVCEIDTRSETRMTSEDNLVLGKALRHDPKFVSIHSNDSEEKTPLVSSEDTTPTTTIVNGASIDTSVMSVKQRTVVTRSDNDDDRTQDADKEHHSVDNLSEGDDTFHSMTSGSNSDHHSKDGSILDKPESDLDSCQRTSTPRSMRLDNLPPVSDVSSDLYRTQISSPTSADYHDCQSENPDVSLLSPLIKKYDNVLDISIKNILTLSASGLDSCGSDQERRDRREQSKPKRKVKRRSDGESKHSVEDSQNTIQIKLYVQGHSDIVLLLLIEKYHLDDEALVHSLYKPSLIELGDMEAQIKACHECHEGKVLEISGSPYHFLHYDTYERDLKGNMLIPVAALETEFVQTSINMHDDFTKSPHLSDITLRSHSSTVYGHRSATHETFFQPPQSQTKNITSDIPQPNDANFCLENRCKTSLLKDHRLVILQ